jgi:hypothetical protein
MDADENLIPANKYESKITSAVVCGQVMTVIGNITSGSQRGALWWDTLYQLSHR